MTTLLKRDHLGLQAFRAALAGRASAPVNVVVMGDSTDEGTGVGTTAADRAKSWPDRFAELLRDRFPTVGETLLQAPNYLPVNTTSPMPTGVTKGGTWTATTNYGVNANAARSQSAGNTLTFPIPTGTTGFEVVSLGGGSITGYTVAIDGGAPSATQGLGGSIRDGYKSALFSVAPGSSHTVVITTVGANSYVHGLLLYAGNETKGIRVFNGGKHGSRAENYRQGGSYGWITGTPPTPTLLGGVQSLIALNPDLLIVGWGINDYTSNSPDVDAAAYRSYLENVVAGVRAVLPTKIIPVLVVGKYRPNAAQSGLGTWEEMIAARAAMVAADPRAANVEMSKRMPDVVSADATTMALYSDTLHSNAKGYQMFADTLAALVAA